MNKLLLLGLAFFVPFLSQAQEDHRIIHIGLNEIQNITLPTLDNEQLLNNEISLRSAERAPRFAESHDVDLTPFNSGTWETTNDGYDIWRIYLESASAKSINLGFTEYHIPESSSLIIYSPQSFEQAGPFTHKDIDAHDQLWTPIIEGDQMIIQLKVPSKRVHEVRLRLSHINHDFAGLRSILSGRCNVDVVCGSEDGPEFEIIDLYRDIIQSVGLATFSGSAFCTGFLVNNVRQDRTPYYMTANHCNVNASNAGSILVYWNFNNSTCREPGSAQSGGAGDGPLNQFNSGAIFRSASGQTDFVLTELDDPVNEDAEAFFAGWDRRDVLPEDSLICVHHPSLDEKRISFEWDSPHRGNWGSGGANVPSGNHIIIPDWDFGTTEPGSSGAPLFDKEKRVRGQLHGGTASCNSDTYDSYGWFHFSWEGGGTANTRLKDWLDPDDTGTEVLNGLGETIVLPVDPNNQRECKPAEVTFNVEVPNVFTQPVNIDIDEVPDGVGVVISENPVTPGTTIQVSFTNLEGITPKSYRSIVKANDGIDSTTADLWYTVVGDLNLKPTLDMPSNLAEDQGLNPDFAWSIFGATEYTHQIQVALDVEFANIVADQTDLTETSFKSTTLETETTYFWRVRSLNLCGPGPWSNTFAFTTGNNTCRDEVSIDVPITITSAGSPTINSILELDVEGDISEISSVTINIGHSYVGDLEAILISPSGKEVVLFDRPGFPASNYGCSGTNLQVVLSDSAPNSAEDFENTCETNPAITGEFMPLESLSAMQGETISGPWVLRIRDNENQDGGELIGWEMNFCTEAQDAFAMDLDPGDVMVCDGEAESFVLTIGNGFSDTGVAISADNLVEGLMVEFDSPTILPGETVTGSVSSVDLIDGEYIFQVIADDGTNMRSVDMFVSIGRTPDVISLNEPTDGATNESINPIFNWEMEMNVGNYILEIAEDVDFNNLAFSIGLITPPYELLDIDLDYDTEYFWRLSALNACGQTLSDIRTFTTTESNSIEGVDLSSIVVYPNPANDYLHISFGDLFFSNLEISILDPLGKLVLKNTYQSFTQQVELDLSGFNSGAYLISISNEDFQIVRKLMVIR